MLLPSISNTSPAAQHRGSTHVVGLLVWLTSARAEAHHPTTPPSGENGGENDGENDGEKVVVAVV